ncbi:MAG: AAA family ATPase [Deltaproteobacteria bacterium]|nr:AAA family ATPase [Deltaproteobacteria bacterium]
MFVSPVFTIPPELEKDIVLYEFNLPSVDDLINLAERVVDVNNLSESVPVEREVISAAKGLTFQEAENAIALSIRETNTISKDIIQLEKLQMVKKSGLMEIYEPVAESEWGGLYNLKQYIHKRKIGFSDSKYPMPRGILLVGLPGSGKSLSAKVIAATLDVPLIKLDIGALKGSLVGQSEERLRQALKMIDAFGFCCVWIDEIEKNLSGVQSSGRSDGGTTSNMFGNLLTWMQESNSPKYIIATCNDLSELLAISQGALLRRFDDIFFLDVPSEKEKEDILKIMNKRYGTDISHKIVANMEGWTGAEIEKFVKATLFEGEKEAFANIKPMSVYNKDIIDRAREWARQNARMANIIEASIDIGDSSAGVRKISN